MFSSQNSQVSDSTTYIEDVFSTYLYTGNGSTQTITNGIDLAGKGGLVWIKGRSGATGHRLTDTVRGATKSLSTTSLNAQATESTGLTAFGATGFDIGADADYNTSSATYVAWGLREQPKFFDIVTWSGNGVSGRQISHSLGASPGCMIIKSSSSNGTWWIVYHRSLGATKYLQLSTTDASATSSATFNNTAPTDAVFTLGDSTHTNASGSTYVAYLFAHDAGGFGLTGTDNVISCGSYTGNGGVNNINLGYEPQWLMIKRTDASGPNWLIFDTMRGWVNDPIIANGGDKYLYANSSAAEGDYYNNLAGDDFGSPTSTGFVLNSASGATNNSGGNFIYIAIRRPMKVPTTGTSVFEPIATSGTYSSPVTLSTGFPVDLIFSKSRGLFTGYGYLPVDRLRGSSAGSTPYLNTPTTNAEVTNSAGFNIANNTGATDAGFWTGAPTGGISYLMFRRAPSVFDEVCYTGTGGANRQISHNLGVQPQLYIVKRRNDTKGWFVGSTLLSGPDYYMYLDLNAAQDSSAGASDVWGTSFPTSSYFLVSDTNGYNNTNTSGDTYVAYLFSTCSGVSKVGSYTGTGTTKQIDCGFTGGARFVLIKRTDSTGDWYVWDSARGIVSGNDPYLLINSTAAEVTNTDYVDTYSAGFEISSTAPAAINASGGTFIFLAIA
jgi:hypothetical protein